MVEILFWRSSDAVVVVVCRVPLHQVGQVQVGRDGGVVGAVGDEAAPQLDARVRAHVTLEVAAVHLLATVAAAQARGARGRRAVADQGCQDDQDEEDEDRGLNGHGDPKDSVADDDDDDDEREGDEGPKVYDKGCKSETFCQYETLNEDAWK